ncbi:MAG: hypothetical protein PVF49_11790, partial [Anaerolineales bacterium]
MTMRLDAYKAVEEKKVTLDVKAVDGYKRAQVEVHNNTQEDIDVDFSTTAFMPTGDSDAQRIGLSYMSEHEPGAYVLSIPPGAAGSVQFEARCLDYHRPAPPSGWGYVPMMVPLPLLICQMLQRGASQQDIWYDIENTSELQSEWQAMDPRREELQEGSIPVSATAHLRGEWYSPQHNYAFELVGHRAYLTVLNNPATQTVGDEVFRITSIEGNKFRGEHGFTDQTWHPVEGEFLSENEMHLRGG